MSEGLRGGIASSLLLKVVVAYLLGTVDSLLYVTILKGAKLGIVMISPHSSIEVGKQLESDTYSVGFFLRYSCHLVMSLVENAKQVLHMVTHLMGYHIGIGKVAISSFFIEVKKVRSM